MFEEKYNITEMHSGGGCVHGFYPLSDDIYWLINHCEDDGEGIPFIKGGASPDLVMVTDDKHQQTMFGLQFQDSDAEDICKEVFKLYTRPLVKELKDMEVHMGDVDAYFVTDFQTGYKLMVAITRAIQTELDSLSNRSINK